MTRVAWSLRDLASNLRAVPEPVCAKSRLLAVKCHAVRILFVDMSASSLVDVFLRDFDKKILISSVLGHENHRVVRHPVGPRKPLKVWVIRGFRGSERLKL